MKKAGIILIFFLFGLPLWSDIPAPPPWIYGQWQTRLQGEEEGVVVVAFLPQDILINGDSVLQMIREGFISSFNQQIRDFIYTIRVEYADGFWWEESFPMPTMTSVYIDPSYEEGSYETMTYFFIPFGAEPLPVPNDFE
jgi:hypothetical protein